MSNAVLLNANLVLQEMLQEHFHQGNNALHLGTARLHLQESLRMLKNLQRVPVNADHTKIFLKYNIL